MSNCTPLASVNEKSLLVPKEERVCTRLDNLILNMTSIVCLKGYMSFEVILLLYVFLFQYLSFLYCFFIQGLYLGPLDPNSVGLPRLRLIIFLRLILVVTPLLKKINHWSEDEMLGLSFKLTLRRFQQFKSKLRMFLKIFM